MLENDHRIIAYTAGKMRKFRIRSIVGDRVKVEMTPYDLHEGPHRFPRKGCRRRRRRGVRKAASSRFQTALSSPGHSHAREVQPAARGPAIPKPTGARGAPRIPSDTYAYRASCLRDPPQLFPVHNPASRQPMAMPRRTSPVLSAQELRQIVRQMVD